MLRGAAFLALLCVVAAATVDQRSGSINGRFHAAEERDSSGGHGHGHSSGGGGHSSGGSSSYSAPSQHSAPASYSAPAAPAPSSSYSAGGNEQGNLYYYYYPVEDYGSTEAADAGFDIFTAIILPLLILGGLLLALSSLTFSFTGRAMREDAEPGMVDQLQTEVERIFYIYLNAFESESCIQRAVCQSGVHAKTYKNKEFFLSLADPFVPETMKGNMAIFKMAAKDGFDTGKCKKYHCTAPKIFQ